MKKIFSFLALALLLAVVVESYAQNQVELPLTGWNYNNGNRWSHSVGDTIKGSTADTLDIGVLGKGGLAPIAVTVAIKTADADVSATPDTTRVAYYAGVGGFYTQIGSTLSEVLTAAGTGIRTFVFNTTGAAVANNTQASVSPHMDALRLILSHTATDSGDSTSYRVRAFGIFNQQ